jgi:hypothetical protein
VGATVEQLKVWSLDTGVGSHQLGIGSDEVLRLVTEATAKRQELEGFTVNSPADQARKMLLLQEANARLKDLRDRADLLVSSYLADVKKSEREDLRNYLLMVANGRADIGDFQRRDLPDLAQLRPFHWELEFPEVFLEGAGFNAIVGNPPFMGGTIISTVLGSSFREYISQWVAKTNSGGRGDLCSYFFLKSFELLAQNGYFGLVATNTISQGDTREIGLDQIIKIGFIYRAVPSRPWSGTAALEVAYVWFKKGKWQGKYYLDDKVVVGITPYLTIPGIAQGNPFLLTANTGKSLTGNKVYGEGFVLEPEEAQVLIAKNSKNKEVLFPYLNGQDLNTNPDQVPSRWVINFFDWPLSPEHEDQKKPKGAPYASDYPDCLEVVERLVKPERDNNKHKDIREKWWQHQRPRLEMYAAIADLNRVLVKALVSPTWAFEWINTGIIFDQKIVVLTVNNLSILQSSIHWVWATQYGSTLGKVTYNYTPTDCFETFPFPKLTPSFQAELEAIGEAYYQHRQAIMSATQLGLTKTYNRFHDPDETDPDIEKLRQLHIEMDNAVAKAYQWDDLLTGDGLNHDFHDTKQGLRFTISEQARREILDRLLQLNHQRYKEEVAQGLHNKKGKKKASKPKQSAPSNPNQLGLNL